MKKILFLILGLASISLEAAHYQSSMSVTPLDKNHEFLVEMQIEKIEDKQSQPELIVSPKIHCKAGEPAQLTVSSDDSNLISINILIEPDSQKNNIQAMLFMKENGQVVLSSDFSLKLNQFSP